MSIRPFILPKDLILPSKTKFLVEKESLVIKPVDGSLTFIKARDSVFRAGVDSNFYNHESDIKDKATLDTLVKIYKLIDNEIPMVIIASLLDDKRIISLIEGHSTDYKNKIKIYEQIEYYIKETNIIDRFILTQNQIIELSKTYSFNGSITFLSKLLGSYYFVSIFHYPNGGYLSADYHYFETREYWETIYESKFVVPITGIYALI